MLEQQLQDQIAKGLELNAELELKERQLKQAQAQQHAAEGEQRKALEEVRSAAVLHAY